MLRKRIEELGLRGSGAYAHYDMMLRWGFLVPHYEIMALDIVRRKLPSLTAYHEIGSGIGVLPFLLAFNGFESVGFECDPRRHNTAVSIWKELCLEVDLSNTTCRLIHARFPGSIQDCDVTNALAILTDFVTTQTPEQLNAILNGLRRYRYVLLDLQRFCVVRDTSEAQFKLLNELRDFGFLLVGEPFNAADCAFVLLHNERVADEGRSASLWSRLLPARWRAQ